MQGFLWVKYDKKNKINIMLPPIFKYFDTDKLNRTLYERLPNHGEHVDSLKTRGILLDGTTQNSHPRLLLQIFSETVLVPVFLSLFSVKGIIDKDLVKVILKHYLNHLNETKFAVVL